MKLKLAILPLCFIALHAFGFEGTVKQSIKNYNGTGNDVNITWYLGAHSCRLDMGARGKDLKGGTTVMLIDPAAGKLRTYDPSSVEKMYIEMSSTSIASNMSAVSVTRTKDTKKIQGYNCEKWTILSSGNSYDVWITRDIDFDAPAYKDFFKGSMEIQALAQEGVKGFPLLTESHTGANASTVESVSAHPISTETLAVPADFKLYKPQSSPPVSK